MTTDCRSIARFAACFARACTAIAVCAIATIGCVQPPGEGQPPPAVPEFTNLVVIQIDTLRSDHLPSYGYDRDTAPFLSRLAEEGIQLQGSAVSSWTRTSIATLLTGLYPQRHQTTTRADCLPDQAPFLPEILCANGFDCRGYSANATVGAKFGFDRGYSSYQSHQTDKHNKPPAATVSTIAADLMSDVQQPFFLYLLYLDPHDPYVPKKSWDGRTLDAYTQPDDIKEKRVPFNKQAIRDMVDQYDAAILETDQAIETLLETFAERGLLDDTLVVVTADHGEEFGEHGGMTHGNTLFEEVLQVPMILWSQGGLTGYRSSDVFYQIDFVPTVLEALGIAPPEQQDGRSKWTVITLQENLGDERQHLAFLDLARRYALSLRSSSYKLIHKRGSPSNLLYDLDRDPGEQNNLVRRSEERSRLLVDLVQYHNKLSLKRVDRQTTTVDDATRRQLAALGYMEEDTPDEELRYRDIPDRLHLYDTRVHGLFGNEPRDRFRTALDPSKSSFQLIRGWKKADDNGRWCAPASSIVLQVRPGRNSQLALTGEVKDQRRRIKCDVTVNGKFMKTHTLGRGLFELVTPLPKIDDPNQLVFIDLEIKPSISMEDIEGELGLCFTSIETK